MPDDWGVHDFEHDFTRQGVMKKDIPVDGVQVPWRVCDLNKDYAISPSYPSVWYVDS